MNLFLWDQMKIGYARQNANQLTVWRVGQLGVHQSNGQASKERATTDTMESLWNEKEHVTDV